jgi:uncharacterized membrane protein
MKRRRNDMMSMSRQGKVVLVLMVGIIAVRLLIFALQIMGLIAFAGFGAGNASIITWILPVAMPLVVITYLLVSGRRGMMGRMASHGSDPETALQILQKRFALGGM